MSEQLISATPHLTTALTGPLQQIEKHLLTHQAEIEAWLREQWRQCPTPLHSSVDLRNAGFKLAPVDTNLFPAGFNNLNPDFMPLCIQAAQATVERYFPGVTKLLIIPESHTRNVAYYESLAILKAIFIKAGFQVRLGSILEGLTQNKTISLPSGKTLTIEPVQRKEKHIHIGDFKPCLIILNNDLSTGIPDILKDVEQMIRPPLSLGWTTRMKSNHFRHYQEVSQELAALIDIDPWLITPLFRNCGAVDFMRHEGEECLIKYSKDLIKEIEKKYKTYGVTHKPFVVIKAEHGTYGMGVLMVQDPEEIRHLNRKQRAHMSATKGHQKVTQVIIQEGVYTFETWGEDEAVAEPVVYMIGTHVVGGFYRVHTQRGEMENLNAPGMSFEPLAFADACINPDKDRDPNDQPNRFYAYGVIGRLALLAAARELKDVGVNR